MDNRIKMKASWGVLVVVGLAGCGGSGGAATAFYSGQYGGTVVEGNRNQAIVTLNVGSNGTINGTCSILSGTNGAIIGRAVLTGSAVVGTGTFQVAGAYESLIPDPPGGGGSGAIGVTGSIPLKGISSGPMHVDDNGIVFHGDISQIPTL